MPKATLTLAPGVIPLIWMKPVFPTGQEPAALSALFCREAGLEEEKMACGPFTPAGDWLTEARSYRVTGSWLLSPLSHHREIDPG